jgi:hypothetical protein
MTNDPPEGSASPDPSSQPGGYEPPSPVTEPAPDPGYGTAPEPGYQQPPGYGQATGYGQGQYYDTPRDQGYAVAQAEHYAVPQGQDSYPVQVSVEYPEHSSRLLAGLSIPYFLARLIMLIPAIFVLYFVGIAAIIVVWIAFWAVLFTGRYPPSFHEFVTGYLRWSTRVSAYLYGLTDKYPPFRLSP